MIDILLMSLPVLGALGFIFQEECFGLLKKVGDLQYLVRRRYELHTPFWVYQFFYKEFTFMLSNPGDRLYDKLKNKWEIYDGVNWKTDQGSRSNTNNSTRDPLAAASRDCTCSRCNSIRALKPRQGAGASVSAECQPLEQLQGAVRAWRLWVLRDTDLVALTQSEHIWKPGENVDSHYRQGLGELNNVGGGFYGFSDYDEIQKQEPGYYAVVSKGGVSGFSDYAIGSILCTGRVKVGTKGVRAEKARPEYLVLTRSDDMNLRLMTTAEKYGMRLVTEDQARELRTGIVPYRESK